MKKSFFFAFFTIVHINLHAVENREEAINFCYEVIDDFAPGSLHLLACLHEVDSLSKKGISELDDFIDNLCHKATEFGIPGDSTETTKRCMDEAKELGFIKKG